MPQHQSAQKRSRQAEKRRNRNRHYTSMMKSAIRKVRTTTDKAAAKTALKNAVTLLDKLAGKRIIHPNKAANQKSRLTRLVNKLP
ncbi:MAG: 30S ribosomal protein S20 [Bacteroidota bacterium]